MCILISTRKLFAFTILFKIFKKILNNHAILDRFVRIEYIISYL